MTPAKPAASASASVSATASATLVKRALKSATTKSKSTTNTTTNTTTTTTNNNVGGLLSPPPYPPHLLSRLLACQSAAQVLTTIDKSHFNLTLPLWAMRIRTGPACGIIHKEMVDRTKLSFNNLTTGLRFLKTVRTRTTENGGFKLMLLASKFNRNVCGTVEELLKEVEQDDAVFLQKFITTPTTTSTTTTTTDSATTATTTTAAAASEPDLDLVPYDINLDYTNWSYEQVLRSIIPPQVEIPGSFSAVGHIIHLNLREEQLPFKWIIGAIMLDRCSQTNIRTIVNKLDEINHTFRFFKMEVLAGEENFITEQKEGVNRFKLDFSQVYWNPRLQTEHKRIVHDFILNEEKEEKKSRSSSSSSFKQTLVCDMFAGIGPFAIPAAKLAPPQPPSNVIILANDLNPVSYSYLSENIQLNKVAHRVVPFNGDAREFVVTSLKRINQVAVVVDDDNTEVTATTISSTQQQWALDKELELIAVQYEKKRRIMKGIKEEAPPITTRALVTPFRMFDHYIMNLPDSSISFLDCFIGLLAPYRHLIAEGGEGLKKLPIVHCHCFSRALDNLEMDVIKRVSAVLGHNIQSSDVVLFHKVRNVAPNKEMVCLSFRMPLSVLLREPESDVSIKRKLSDEETITEDKKLKVGPVTH